jgi:TRAP-type uncharacterized transport system fused permease subunit
MLRGSLFEVITAIIACVIATYLVVIGFEGWMLTELKPVERILLVAFAIIIPFPIVLSIPEGVLVGVILIAATYLLQRGRRRKLTTEPA